MNRSLTKSGKNSASIKVTMRSDELESCRPLIEEIDLNLRSSCLACAFVSNCIIAEARASPDLDVLVGSYRFLSLKDKCLV
jgi:hypothetical protein